MILFVFPFHIITINIIYLFIYLFCKSFFADLVLLQPVNIKMLIRQMIYLPFSYDKTYGFTSLEQILLHIAVYHKNTK